MIPWHMRPPEIAHLLNPAFCGEILRRSIKTYNTRINCAMPYALLFLILPIVLHSPTRMKITAHKRQLHVWIQENPEVRIGFASRAESLIPVTKEAISFLLQMNAIQIDQNSNVMVVPYRRRRLTSQTVGEVGDCYSKAEILGRLFAHAGAPSTIFTMWGVRP